MATFGFKQVGLDLIPGAGWAVMSRQSCIKGLLNQSETMPSANLAKKKRMHFPTATHGLAIKGVGVPACDRAQKTHGNYAPAGRELTSLWQESHEPYLYEAEQPCFPQ